jgi:predicted transposase/invertase (TIGR01784 family)
MGFVDPRTDFGFKRIFASERSKPILRSLLNAIIYDDEPRITDLEIIDPYQNPAIYDLKQSILDVKAVLDNETIVIIEMQILPVEAFAERVIYNTAKAYVNQLQRGQGYMSLKPVISLTITDFVLFTDTEHPISRYQLLEPGTDRRCSDHLEVIFAELPKISKLPEQLAKRSDRWLYFIQQAGKLDEIPTFLLDTDFDAAFEIANESQLSRPELELSEKQRMNLLDEQGRLSYAIKEGLKQGLEQGREEGAEARAIEIAREMLTEFGVETVSRVTGLPIAIVQDLANGIDGSGVG